MKYIKYYEKRVEDIDINDYVIVDYNDIFTSKIALYLKNTIGRVKSALGETIYVDYGYNVPKELQQYFSRADYGDYIKIVKAKDIIFSSQDRKDVEAYLNSNKFNI